MRSVGGTKLGPVLTFTGKKTDAPKKDTKAVDKTDVKLTDDDTLKMDQDKKFIPGTCRDSD